MSYASGTTHYNLPQTVGSDKRDWADTNQAFSDIDAAIYGAAQGASAATSAIETINGQIETITGKQAVDEGNISTLAGKVSTLESTVGNQGAAIADVRQDLQDNIESNYEASATSTHAYAIGDTFFYNDVLYKATAAIAIGGTIVPSTNCTAITVMSELHNDFKGIDTAHTIGSITTPAGTYTATEDCWCIGRISNGTSNRAAQVSINGVVVATGYVTTTPEESSLFPVILPIKAGQTVTTRDETGNEYNLVFFKILK